jgi:hypothetical protein
MRFLRPAVSFAMAVAFHVAATGLAHADESPPPSGGTLTTLASGQGYGFLALDAKSLYSGMGGVGPGGLVVLTPK